MTGDHTGYTFDIPIAEWLSANYRDRWTRERITKQMRKDAWQYACVNRFPAYDYVAIEATPYGRRACRFDPGNLYPTVKAVVDGLVDAKKLRGDTRKTVDRVTMHKPQPADAEWLRLRVVRVVPVQPPLEGITT